jgi:3-oxoacyl-[acyl-carrier-protein] synthase-3
VGTSRLRGAVRTKGARVLSFGAARPARTLVAAELGEPFGRSADWIETRTGITQLRRLGPGERLGALACAAARDAITDAGVPADTIDLVVLASCSLPTGTGPLAAELGRRLTPRAAVLDLNCACAGFCYGLASADALIRAGAANTVLLVAAEQMSSLLDPADLGTSIIFGDGAGAAVLRPAVDGEVYIGPVAWGSDGARADLIQVPERARGMRMQGQRVFRWAVDEMHKVASTACARAGVQPAQIDVFVPHQANLRIIDAMVRRLDLGAAVIATDVTCSGNTSAASIPMALTRLIDEGRVRGGQLALLVGFGAGLGYAAQVLRLP